MRWVIYKFFVSLKAGNSVAFQVFQKMKSSMGSTSQYKFGVLTRIVRHMKERHMEGHTAPG